MLLMTLEINECESVEIKDQQMVLEEGCPGTKVYVLKEGNVSVWQENNKIIDLSEPGLIFGEISVLLGRNHTATVKSMGTSQFYVIDDFLTFLKQNPTESIEILKLMCERVVTANKNLLSLKDEPWWKIWT